MENNSPEPEQLHQTETQETNPEVIAPIPQPTVEKKPRKKLLLVLLLVLLVAAGAAAFVILRQSDKQDSSKTPSVQRDVLANTNPVVCVNLGYAYLQCENIETKELAKYELPTALQQITQITPSPDGKNFIVSKWSDDSIEVTRLYDANFKEIKTLAKSDATGTPPKTHLWADKNKLLEIDNTQLTVTEISVDSFQRKELGKISPDEKHTYGYTFIGTDGSHLYAYTQMDNQETGSAEDKLLDIPLTDFKATEIGFENAESSVDLNQSEEGYLADVDKFALLSNSDHNRGLHIFEINRSGQASKLRKLHELKRAPAISMSVARYVTTSKGILTIDSDKDGFGVEGSAFYATTSKDERQKLQLVNDGGMIISLPGFPNLKKAAVAQAELKDYVKAPTNTPKKVLAFAESQAKTDCDSSPYRKVEVMAFDGENQVNLYLAGCGKGASYYYILTNGAYKEVYGTQEGISCAERDAKGLTAVVAPGCRKPGEGL